MINKLFYLNRSGGFSILELLIVVAVLGFVSTLTIVSLSSLTRANVLDSAAGDIISALSEARSRTLTSEGDTVHGIHFSTNAITRFTGGTYSAVDPTNVVLSLPPSVTLSSTALTGGAVDVVFARLTGVASATGTVTIAKSSDATDTKIITITTAGISTTN
jgi:prepilin-type N-terminal cleavage/methylation domain-containing protein